MIVDIGGRDRDAGNHAHQRGVDLVAGALADQANNPMSSDRVESPTRIHYDATERLVADHERDEHAPQQEEDRCSSGSRA
jgi:hypothetical protein